MTPPPHDPEPTPSPHPAPLPAAHRLPPPPRKRRPPHPPRLRARAKNAAKERFLSSLTPILGLGLWQVRHHIRVSSSPKKWRIAATVVRPGRQEDQEAPIYSITAVISPEWSLHSLRGHHRALFERLHAKWHRLGEILLGSAPAPAVRLHPGLRTAVSIRQLTFASLLNTTATVIGTNPWYLYFGFHNHLSVTAPSPQEASALLRADLLREISRRLHPTLA